MITLEINGLEVKAEAGQNILQAAAGAGIEIPHFCWHPGLKLAGNCRMCLVEIEGIPKLQIACGTPIKEGMKVKTESPAVVAARRGVLEFLLINHPIDCPVCDQAGECYLQNYYQQYGLYQSRFGETKVHKDKVIDLGSGVMLDMERCVLCDRCTRFMREIARDEQLGIVRRGNHSQIQTLTGKQLDSIYAGNIYDICPVGALTSKDFRFKCRVWYLGSTASVCPACATGCSIWLDHHKNTIHRIRPRHNPTVNDYWMCDIGRRHYKRLSDESRLVLSLKKDGGRLQPVGYDQAVGEIAAALTRIESQHGSKEIGFIGSPQMTNEDAFLFTHWARDLVGSFNLDYSNAPEEKPFSDTILIREDRNPNSQGCHDMGIIPRHGGMRIRDMLAAARRGTLKALIVADNDLFVKKSQEMGIVQAFEAIELIVLLQPFRNRMMDYAHYVLPTALWAEQEGSFTNYAGIVQKINRAVDPPVGVKPVYQVVQDLARAMGKDIAGSTAAEVFATITATIAGYRNLAYDTLGTTGQKTGLPPDQDRLK